MTAPGGRLAPPSADGQKALGAEDRRQAGQRVQASPRPPSILNRSLPKIQETGRHFGSLQIC